jgi:hypothetical protein
MKMEVYVGDLCYVCSDANWNEKCNRMSAADNWESLVTEGESAMCATGIGDGIFDGSSGGYYGVDSGTLGIIWRDKVTKENGLHLGNIFEVDVPDPGNLPPLRAENRDNHIVLYAGNDEIEMVIVDDKEFWMDDELEEIRLDNEIYYMYNEE